MVIASEDVGLAYPQAVPIVKPALTAPICWVCRKLVSP
ncbi:MAG: hypothetical protein ACLUNZ_13420 [Evtepia sp.]